MKAHFFLLGLLALYAQAQVPRLADGKPDLGSGGVWTPRAVPDLGSGVEVPFQDWARLKFNENHAVKSNAEDARCLPPGVPRISVMARPFEIMQAANRIIFVYEGGARVWRQVWMDGRAHPKDPNPDWLGDSIGHWEGATLVVDALGFNDRTWLDDAGHPHTERLHVIERYTRTDKATMRYEVAIDDPGAYTRTWTSGTILAFRAGATPAEDICLDKPTN